MRTIFIRLGLVAALAVGGCGKDDAVSPTASKPGAAADTVSLRLDHPLTVDDLRVEWLEVQDSRCPEGVECFWEGEVKVVLGVAEGGVDLGKAEATLRAGDEDRARTSIGKHDLRLLAVDPYPRYRVQTPRADYAATLVIAAR